MKKKFRKLLSEKCKDMGLTDKALDDLVEIGAAKAYAQFPVTIVMHEDV